MTLLTCACSFKDYGYLGAEFASGDSGGVAGASAAGGTDAGQGGALERGGASGNASAGAPTGGGPGAGAAGQPDLGGQSGQDGEAGQGGQSGQAGQGGHDGQVGHAGEPGSGGAAGLETPVDAGAGTSGAGGRGGAGGVDEQPVCPEAIGSGTDGLIDDFEDGDLSTRALDGRHGSVLTSSDGSAVMTAVVGTPGRNGLRALHVQSDAKLVRWGGIVEVHLLETTRLCRYDARNYSGIRVSVRGTTEFSLGLQTYDTLPEDVGGCVSNCNAAYGAPLEPSETWTEVFVPFTEFQQPGTYGQSAVDTAELMLVELRFGRTTVPVELWVDDLAFY